MTSDPGPTDEPSEVDPLLRALRTAAGLTQEELAERAGLGTRSIQGIESGERRPRRETVHQLAAALGVSSADRARLESLAKASERQRPHLDRVDLAIDRPAGLTPRRGALHRLPAPLSSFVGRERELDELKRYLDSTRLLTLTGPPGVGKTRLAQEVAAREGAAFADGVRFIPVAAIRDPDLLLSAIAQSVGVEGNERQPLLALVADALREARLLLVLDNFEQVVAAGPLLSELLEACPRLTALVTSRTRLRVRGEREFVIPPLTLPDHTTGASTENALSQVLLSEAARLFVERAREARADVAVTDDHAAIFAEICRRLDGSPLAIGLAAARNDARRALRLAGAADGLCETIGDRCPPDRQARLTRRLAAARATLGEEASTIIWAEGRAMTLKQVIADALEGDGE